MEWYYERDGQAVGPVSEETLREMIRNGALAASCRVWCSAYGSEWKRIADTMEFQAELPSLPNADLHPDTPNRDLTARARAALKGHWGMAILAFVIYMLVSQATGQIPFAGLVAVYILAGPLIIGLLVYFLKVARCQEAKIGDLFAGFSNKFGRFVWAYFRVLIFTILWSFLFIVPGIIKSYSYMMTFYILADNPELTAREAMERSIKMMYGYRFKLFCLGLRFIGWLLLCIPTLGIGLLWLWPYMQTSFACFYDSVKSRA